MILHPLTAVEASGAGGFDARLEIPKWPQGIQDIEAVDVDGILAGWCRRSCNSAEEKSSE